jgi:hypothetical protein
MEHYSGNVVAVNSNLRIAVSSLSLSTAEFVPIFLLPTGALHCTAEAINPLF